MLDFSDSLILIPKPARRLWLTRLLSILLPLLIVALLLTQVTWAEGAALLQAVSPFWVTLGVLFYLATNIVRACRIKALLPEYSLNFWRLGSIVIAQSMFNNILPARVGEVAFVYLLRKHEAITVNQAVVALVVARITDYLAVATFFIIAALALLSELPPTTDIIVGLVMVGMGVIVVLLLSLAWLGGQSLLIIGWVLQKFGLAEHRLAIWGMEKGTQLVAGLASTQSPRRLLGVFGWSLGVWALTFGWFFAFLQGVGIQTEGYRLVVGSTFAVLSKAIPFISTGGLGAHEAGWTMGFVLVGFETSTAVLSGLAVNLLTLIASIIAGGIALVLLRWRWPGPQLG